MKASRLSVAQLKKIHQLYLSGSINFTRSARELSLARNTLKRHIRLLDHLAVSEPLNLTNAQYCVSFLKTPGPPNGALICLRKILPGLVVKNSGQNRKALWSAYREIEPNGYSYSQFAYRYAEWVLKNPLSSDPLQLPVADQVLLKQWRHCNDRRKWEKAVILLDAASGEPTKIIAGKVERSPEKVRSWLKQYQEAGIIAFTQRPTRRLKAALTQQITLKKENLIRLIHEAPALHGYNRTSWRLVDLSATFKKIYGTALSISTISVYLKSEGYVFRKARKVLTSPDPDFREKLSQIQNILRNLGPKEKFFSVDEYGPFSVKIKGGTSFVRRGETKTYPQHQPSKGCLICTAALELSTNQVTHFYSLKKDTAEMIRLVELLRIKYRGQEKIYFSWDAAAWHASKKLREHLEIINDGNHRAESHTPLVELAPLPASAQFLNVIESVFSGLARSVIHHSDYPNVGYCKAAIDRYFAERNQYFKQNPKRAGNKIWGKERTVPEFRDSHNCKDPAWR